MHSEPIVDTAVNPGKHQSDPEKWVDLHSDFLFSYAYSRINDEELARDLVQETFLAALEKPGAFRGESSERTWLTAIIKYKVIDVYRKKARAFTTKEGYGMPADDEDFFDPELNNWKKEHWPEPFVCKGTDPLEDKEFMDILHKCLQKLPSLWMSVFRLKHMDDEKTEDICKALRLSASNYWVIIHRAKVNLRSCLQKNWI
ncbi:MAG: sigma-70 family RNA polymerase sigma factor [Mucilaginibacter sp.]